MIADILMLYGCNLTLLLLQEWLKSYSHRRYGKAIHQVEAAWEILYHHTIYNCTDGIEVCFLLKIYGIRYLNVILSLKNSLKKITRKGNIIQCHIVIEWFSSIFWCITLFICVACHFSLFYELLELNIMLKRVLFS